VAGYIYSIYSPFYSGGPASKAPLIIATIAISFLIGICISLIFFEIIESGVATTFVCLAEDPNALRRTKPDLYEKIRQTYPEITFG
jgi:hypothetical protein